MFVYYIVLTLTSSPLILLFFLTKLFIFVSSFFSLTLQVSKMVLSNPPPKLCFIYLFIYLFIS